MDATASNYESDAPVKLDGSCTYPPVGINCNGVDDGALCYCADVPNPATWINPASGLESCGDCAYPETIRLNSPPPGCDCSGTASQAPGGTGFY